MHICCCNVRAEPTHCTGVFGFYLGRMANRVTREPDFSKMSVRWRTSYFVRKGCMQCFHGTMAPSRDSATCLYIFRSYCNLEYGRWQKIVMQTPSLFLRNKFSLSTTSEKGVIMQFPTLSWAAIDTPNVPLDSFKIFLIIIFLPLVHNLVCNFHSEQWPGNLW